MPTPHADRHLEPGIFPGRLREVVDAAIGGRLDGAACVVLPRTCDADYKCFLYLRELSRRGIVRRAPPILLFDLLQSTGSEVAAHNASRARALFASLAAAAGTATSPASLRDEIWRTNAARGAMRRLLALRGPSPRVSGAEVLPLLGAFWQLAPEAYTSLAAAAADSVARRAVLEGPRVLLLGAPVDGPALHAAIESHGAVVVAEMGPWGSGAPGGDVEVEADPFAAIADKYCRDAWGPRTPVADSRRWITQALPGVTAVVVSLPPDDAVFGWDYPWLRERLRAAGVPHVCVTVDPGQPISGGEQERLAALVRAAGPCAEMRRG